MYKHLRRCFSIVMTIKDVYKRQGIVSPDDRKPIGYPNVPEITYGFGASVKWKGFDLSVFFQGVGNVNFFANNTYTQPFTANSVSLSNVFTDLIGNYWSENNPDANAKYPRLTTSANPNNSQQSTFWMVNGRYMRLKNAEIGYSCLLYTSLLRYTSAFVYHTIYRTA